MTVDIQHCISFRRTAWRLDICITYEMVTTKCGSRLTPHSDDAVTDRGACVVRHVPITLS